MSRGASLQRALVAAAKRAGSDSTRAFSDVASTGSTMQQARGLRTMAARGSVAWSNSSANSTGLTKSSRHADGCPCTSCCSMNSAEGQRGVQTVAELEPCPNMNIAQRHKVMLNHFPTAMGVDDFMARVELALAGYGFTGDNSIAMSNLCRDESCMVLEDKIETVFGSCFSTHGLGGVLTCGVIGIKAGLSHSPVSGGKERYVFFSFPHIAIDSDGNVGTISRPNRPGDSSACGALIAALGDLKSKDLKDLVQQPAEHDPLNPEYSILRSRLARRIMHEGIDPKKLDLVSVTAAAERTITSDLEFLISKAVDPTKADYAVITGVQIHNWSSDLTNPDIPSIEFVAPSKAFVVTNGEKHYVDLHRVPAMSPRQLKAMAGGKAGAGGSATTDSAYTSGDAGSMLVEIPHAYLMKRLGGAIADSHVESDAHTGPTWREYVKSTWAESHPGAPTMECEFEVPPPKEEEQVPTSFINTLLHGTWAHKKK